MDSQNSHAIAKTFRLFLMLALPLGAVLAGLLYLFYQTEYDSFLEYLKTEERLSIRLQEASIHKDFQVVVSDLMFLSRQNELLDYLTQGRESSTSDIQREYLLLATGTGRYDQIRFLDVWGMEKVRVNYRDGQPVVVPDHALQDKSERYYFQEGIVLDPLQVFVSAMDLNKEKGRVETPLKPSIRFVTPVFDYNGKRRGVVILNYLASRLLEQIEAIGRTTPGHTSLLNDKGYWLLCPDKSLEWGFMFKDRMDATFANRFPEEWAAMLEMGQGSLETANGLFTFSLVHPLETLAREEAGPDGRQSPQCLSSADYRWFLVSHDNPDTLAGQRATLRARIAPYGAGLFLVAAIGAWFLALAITRRQIYQARLLVMAQYDALTGLPNRKLFFDRLTNGIQNAERYQRRLGLLYIDLDGFKGVNDSMGHDAGDELLKAVARVLRDNIRKSDTAARLGGDEFAVILSEVSEEESPGLVAKKIIDALCTPITLAKGTALIGASIGAAVYPDNATREEDLVHRADEAMYRAKAGGKNRCVAAEG